MQARGNGIEFIKYMVEVEIQCQFNVFFQVDKGLLLVELNSCVEFHLWDSGGALPASFEKPKDIVLISF